LSRSSIPRGLRDAVWERDAGRCRYCGLGQLGHGATFPETGERVPLFNPLQQIWRVHFRLEPYGDCVGLTAVGRATAVALGMNAMIPRVARASQIALGLLSTFSS
jgi:hypothetical protein